jgi:O-antigen ligase
VTCQYVAAAVNGGIAGLVILAMIFVVAFRRIGVVMSSPKKSEVFVGYFIGVALISHLMSFLGVSYFGQIFLLLYVTLGATASLAATVASGKSAKVRSSTPVRTARPHSRESIRLDGLGPRRFI